MTKLAIIGGTGLTALSCLQITRREVVNTRYGEPSGPVSHGVLSGAEVAFLPRHGPGHTIPPHKVNYRANVWALRQIGVENVIAVASVGGINPALKPSQLVFPDQIIDYTWSREHTFFDGESAGVVHVDFTKPYSATIRGVLCDSAAEAGLEVLSSGTYGATQGPRLETAAEIDRLERDGCDIVGMTGMPEVALAREIGLNYATCAVVANVAAGRGEGEILISDIEANLTVGMENVRVLLERAVPMLYAD